MDQQKTGQYLKKLGNEKKLTQEQLAEKFNVSSRSVSRWETGRNLPDISLLVEIADFYEVDVREIIDGEAMPREEEKMQEVAEKMADYAKQEKSRLLKFIQVISFAGIEFCNYFLDVDIRQYLPDEYLLKNFDASDNNPYRQKMLPYICQLQNMRKIC